MDNKLPAQIMQGLRSPREARPPDFTLIAKFYMSNLLCILIYQQLTVLDPAETRSSFNGPFLILLFVLIEMTPHLV